MIITLIEVVSTLSIVNLVYQKKEYLKLICFTLILFTINYLIKLYQIDNYIYRICSSIIIYLYTLTITKKNDLKNIFISLIPLSLLDIATIIAYLPYSYLFNDLNNFDLFQLVIITHIVYLFLIYYTSIFIRNTHHFNNKSFILSNISLLLISTLFTLSLDQIFIGTSTNIHLIIILLVALFIIFIMLFNESLQDAKKIFNHQMQIKILEEQKNNYQLSKENIDSFNKTKHDLAHIFTSILYELDNNNQQQACNIITTQLNKLENLNKIIITGNDLIDYCISIKTNVIKTNNIKVICDCFEDNFPLNNEDLFIVFGNLLNNAIENCQSNPTKQILISSGIKNNFAYFKIRNTITKSVLKQNPQLITTKANHETHGLGIKNCHDIISKYHGYLDFSEDDLFFIVKVIIPIK